MSKNNQETQPMTPPAKAPVHMGDRLQSIDRRILWLILLVVVSLFTVFPVTVLNATDPRSKALWKTIDETPKSKMVLLSSDWSKGTRGENQGQFVAVVRHLMTRRTRFALSSFDAPSNEVAMTLLTGLAREYGYKYGTDWINFGYQASPNNYVKGINVDLIATVRTDSVEHKPLQTFPVMQGVKSLDDFHIVVEFSASAFHLTWIQFLSQDVKLGFCPTSVMAPEALAYCASGQLVGILWGAKGAYDYEQLNEQAHTGKFGIGRRYMGPLSAAFALVILSITIGNIGMFWSRSKASEEARQ